MKNKPCKYALYTVLTGTLLPLVLGLTYIVCLWKSSALSPYFFSREVLKVAETCLGCVIFSLCCASFWECLYSRHRP